MLLWTIALYAFSLLCIGFYIYLDTSTELMNWLNEVDSNHTTAGFKLYILVGLIKLISILLGATLFAVLTLRLIKDSTLTSK